MVPSVTDTVPLFVAPRLCRYASWQPITLHGARLGPLRWLIPLDPLLGDKLRAWEHLHPLIMLPSVMSAAR